MFELDESIISDIMFAMENQDTDFAIIKRNGEVIQMERCIEESAYDSSSEVLLTIPEWSSTQGYQLMEDFTAGVSDPIARVNLRTALNRGKGVFKAFKIELEKLPSLLQRWYEFKEASMRRYIIDWYNSMADSHELSELGPEPEAYENLLDFDLIFKIDYNNCHDQFADTIKQAYEEAMYDFPKPLIAYEYNKRMEELAEQNDNALLFTKAEAFAGALAGIAISKQYYIEGFSFARLLFLFVAKEYRNMGLARRLIENSRNELLKKDISNFIIDLPVLPKGFEEDLAVYGYKKFAAKFINKF